MANAHPLVMKLRQSGLLTEEDHGVLERVCNAAEHVAADTALIEEGERLTGVPLILAGFAYRSRLLPDGKRQILGVLMPGDFCDIQGAILGRSDHFTTTLTPCSVVWLSRETVDDLTLNPSRIARAMWWAALVDECILRSWLTNMGQRPADQCLAHFCCEFLLRLQVVGAAEHDGCEMPLTQEKIADALGITPVHVNRVLKELRQLDLLQMNNRRLVVPDVAKLWRYCQFDPTYLHLKALDGLPIVAA